MTHPITILGFIPSFFGALFTVGSLYAMGRVVLSFLGTDRFGHHVPVAIGFGINHLVFLAVSLLMDGPGAVLFMNVLHAAVLGVFLLSRLGKPIVPVRIEPMGAILMLVVIFPYVFRLFSPPMNVDGLLFYLPNMEWVYHRGLSFNPHLTAYTTMPMAAEEPNREYEKASRYNLITIVVVFSTGPPSVRIQIISKRRNAQMDNRSVIT
jgi:hypothetical protein